MHRLERAALWCQLERKLTSLANSYEHIKPFFWLIGALEYDKLGLVYSKTSALLVVIIPHCYVIEYKLDLRFRLLFNHHIEYMMRQFDLMSDGAQEVLDNKDSAPAHAIAAEYILTLNECKNILMQLKYGGQT